MWLLLACTAPDAPPTTEEPVLPEWERFDVAGTVLDLEGEPVFDMFVTVSTDFCIPDRTAADGAFSVGQVDPGPQRLITYGETAFNGLFASTSMALRRTDRSPSPIRSAHPASPRSTPGSQRGHPPGVDHRRRAQAQHRPPVRSRLRRSARTSCRWPGCPWTMRPPIES